MLEYACCDGRIGLFCRVPDQLAPIVLGPLKAKYPNCTLSAMNNDHGTRPYSPLLKLMRFDVQLPDLPNGIAVRDTLHVDGGDACLCRARPTRSTNATVVTIAEELFWETHKGTPPIHRGAR